MSDATATWKAKPQDVERIVAAVLPHVSPDGYLPMTTCVNVDVTADRFIVAATDRYTLGVCSESLAEWDPDVADVTPLSANIFARDLRRIFTFLKTHKKTTATWSLSATSLTVQVGGESLSVRTVDVEFREWRTMLGGLVDKPNAAIPAISFDPIRIDAFTQSAKALGERVMRWQLGGLATDAPIVRIGKEFVGVLMPLRSDDVPALDLAPFGIESAKEIAA